MKNGASCVQGNDTISKTTRRFYKVSTMTESGDKIYQELIRQPPEDPVIVVGHNGPKGLGDQRHDPCGKDFRPTEGIALCLALHLHTYQSVRLGHMLCALQWLWHTL